MQRVKGLLSSNVVFEQYISDHFSIYLTIYGLIIYGHLVNGGCAIWVFSSSQRGNMHPCFLLWYLFLGLRGCTPCLVEGSENTA